MSEQSFLDAVLAAPDDDAPRLVYADWLDEHGQAERAEFIRVQCQLRRMLYVNPKSESVYKQWDSLRRRQRKLRANAGGWCDGVIAGFDVKNLVFLRGFIAQMKCTEGEWRRMGADVLRSHPLEKLTLTGVRDWTIGRWFDEHGKGSLRELKLVVDATDYVFEFGEYYRDFEDPMRRLGLKTMVEVSFPSDGRPLFAGLIPTPPPRAARGRP